MAKYEARIKGDFDKVLSILEKEILESSPAISLIDKSDFCSENSKCGVRVFYYTSLIADGNRATLNLTLFKNEENYIELSAITSGWITLLPIKSRKTKLIDIVQEILNKNFK